MRANFSPSVETMTEDWELKSLERRVDSLEGRWKDAEESRRRRQVWWGTMIWWTYIVVIVTVTITLVVAAGLNHH
jgi:hypothetical protein